MRNRSTGILPLAFLAAATMGAGPCELLDMLGDAPDAGECGQACENRLDVRIVRADNEAFWGGTYVFAIGLTDGSVYAVDCTLVDAEAGFECGSGDTAVLFPFVESGGEAIVLAVAGAPERLVVAVEYAGALIGERELVPAYEEVGSGADGCPACLEGEDSMAVTPW